MQFTQFGQTGLTVPRMILENEAGRSQNRIPQGSKEKVALRNEPLLASLAIQLNAGPMVFGESRRGYVLNITTEERKFMSVTGVLRERNQ
jgi:hypothetical protein